MTDNKDAYFGVELGLTFLLVTISVTLIHAYLPFGLKDAFIPLLVASFAFGWFNRKSMGRIMRNLAAFGAVGVICWAFYSAVESTLLYKDIILICIRTIFFLEIALSLNAGKTGFLPYIQSLSMLLVMGFPLFGNVYESNLLVVLVEYFILWILILNTRFYSTFNSSRSLKKRRYHSIYLAVLLFIAVAVLSRALFISLPLVNINRGGIFLEKELSIEKMADVETEYYDLQDSLQKEIIKFLPKLDSSNEQYEVLRLLNEVIKDTKYTQEVRKAEQGLISRLKTPGPGIEKADTQDITSQIQKYTQKKASAKLRNMIVSMREKMSQEKFGIMEKLMILMRLSKILYGNSYKELFEQKREIKMTLAASSVKERAKEEIREMVDDLIAWKIFELYRTKLDSLEKKISSLGGSYRKMAEELTSKIEEMEDSAALNAALATAAKRWEGENSIPREVRENFKDVLSLKAHLLVAEESKSLNERLKEDEFSNSQAKKLKEKLEGVQNSSSVAQLVKNMDSPDAKQDEGSVSLKLQSIAELKMDILQEENKKEAEARKNQRLFVEKSKEGNGAFLKSPMGLFLTVVLFSIFLILVLLLIFYFARERKKKVMLALFKSDPRKFLLNLFENANKVLAVFDFRRDAVLPPLELAYSVQNKYSISSNIFIKLAVSYEEAKYSKHVLDGSSCIQALNDYNSFLNEFFSKHRKTAIIIGYLKALFMMIPFSLPKE